MGKRKSPTKATALAPLARTSAERADMRSRAEHDNARVSFATCCGGLDEQPPEQDCGRRYEYLDPRQGLERQRNTVAALAAALKFLADKHAWCDECGQPGTRYFTTEGDGPFWLCDSMDARHAVPDVYSGETEERCDWSAALAAVEAPSEQQGLNAPQPAPKPGGVPVWLLLIAEVERAHAGGEDVEVRAAGALMIADMRERAAVERKTGMPVSDGRDDLAGAYEAALVCARRLRGAVGVEAPDVTLYERLMAPALALAHGLRHEIFVRDGK